MFRVSRMIMTPLCTMEHTTLQKIAVYQLFYLKTPPSASIGLDKETDSLLLISCKSTNGIAQVWRYNSKCILYAHTYTACPFTIFCIVHEMIITLYLYRECIPTA